MIYEDMRPILVPLEELAARTKYIGGGGWPHMQILVKGGTVAQLWTKFLEKLKVYYNLVCETYQDENKKEDSIK